MCLKFKILFFYFSLICSVAAVAQNTPHSYAEANPGILHVILDVSSDSAHLKSLIGEFTAEDVLQLKAFFNNPCNVQLDIESRTSHENPRYRNIDTFGPWFKIVQNYLKF